MTIPFSIDRILFLTIGMLLFYNCSSFVDNDNFPSTDEQRLSLSLENIHNVVDLKSASIAFCNEFYKHRNFKTIWIKDSVVRANSFLEYVNDEIKLNLPQNHLKTPRFEASMNPYQKEILTILRLAEYLGIQSKGLINFKDSTLYDSEYSKLEYLNAFVRNHKSNKNWISHLLSFDIKDNRIQGLHRALNDFTSNFPLNDNIIQIDLEKDTIGSESNHIAKNLKEKGFIGDINISKDSLINVFKTFQYMNGLQPDGVLGKNSLHALHQTNLDRYYKGIIALEKLKSVPDSIIQSKFIEVNIPTFLLHFYNADTTVSRHRVVVGANKTQTPEFEAPIKFIVTHPYWHVPYSIASTEILYGAKSDSNYFHKKNYTVLKSGEKVSPDSIDWESIKSYNFPYRIRQETGRSNSLGILKILFPNKHAIYIHDTPSKHLFRKDIRNYSHGCIRVEEPFRLAKNILSLEDHVYADSLDVLALRQKETYLNVNDTFLVHIRYRTVDFDDSTKQLRFYNDIYKREEKFLNLFTPQRP